MYLEMVNLAQIQRLILVLMDLLHSMNPEEFGNKSLIRGFFIFKKNNNYEKNLCIYFHNTIFYLLCSGEQFVKKKYDRRSNQYSGIRYV